MSKLLKIHNLIIFAKFFLLYKITSQVPGVKMQALLGVQEPLFYLPRSDRVAVAEVRQADLTRPCRTREQRVAGQPQGEWGCQRDRDGVPLSRRQHGKGGMKDNSSATSPLPHSDITVPHKAVLRVNHVCQRRLLPSMFF